MSEATIATLERAYKAWQTALDNDDEYQGELAEGHLYPLMLDALPRLIKEHYHLNVAVEALRLIGGWRASWNGATPVGVRGWENTVEGMEAVALTSLEAMKL